MTAFDPRRLLRTLVEHEVEFVVIGLTAAALQGSPVSTLDVDIAPRMDLDNAERLAAALNALDAREAGGASAELAGEDFLGWQARQFETSAGPLDVVPRPVGMGDHDSMATVVIRLGDLEIRCATLDEIIASKEALGRVKDQAALPALYATRRAIEERRGQ